ncbi:translation initiation factor IF-2-like [Oxyura jamaicensis]|uniref:translation initiation factor IF-2-like n=1 Tax=Oxyura jamaicensis TaxID=8884 RepID=UPI0015A6CD96|nr:translation initiation factor IF-2-like [Oxyura jamaicensis]
MAGSLGALPYLATGAGAAGASFSAPPAAGPRSAPAPPGARSGAERCAPAQVRAAVGAGGQGEARRRRPGGCAAPGAPPHCSVSRNPSRERQPITPGPPPSLAGGRGERSRRPIARRPAWVEPPRRPRPSRGRAVPGRPVGRGRAPRASPRAPRSVRGPARPRAPLREAEAEAVVVAVATPRCWARPGAARIARSCIQGRRRCPVMRKWKKYAVREEMMF